MTNDRSQTSTNAPERQRPRPRSFFADKRGSINIMMAALMPVVAAGVGVVLDGANLIRVQNNLQESTDSAALAAAILVVNGEKDNRNGNKVKKGDMEAAAEDYLDANFRAEGFVEGGAGARLVKLTKNDNSITVETSYQQRHFIMGMFGEQSTQIGASATVGLPDASARGIFASPSCWTIRSPCTARR